MAALQYLLPLILLLIIGLLSPVTASTNTSDIFSPAWGNFTPEVGVNDIDYFRFSDDNVNASQVCNILSMDGSWKVEIHVVFRD